MSEKEKAGFNMKLTDDALEDVTGGSLIIRNATFDKNEKVGTHSAILDDSTNGKISMLGGAIKSGNQNTPNVNIREGHGIAGKNNHIGGDIVSC